jgi:hypothetical protein
MNDDLMGSSDESLGTPDSAEQTQDKTQLRQVRARIQSAYSLPRSGPEVLSKILKAYVIASKQGAEAIKYTDVAAVASLHPTVVSGNNSFLAESKFIVSERYGYYKPSPETIEFAKTAPWDEAGAKKFVRGQIDGTWYGETVRQQFQMFDTLTKDQQIRAFGLKSVADESDKNKLDFLFDFLVYFEYVIPDESGNYTLSRDETGEKKEGLRRINEIVSDVTKDLSPIDGPEEFLGRASARPQPASPPAAQININININSSTTDEELEALVRKAKFVLDTIRENNSLT